MGLRQVARDPIKGKKINIIWMNGKKYAKKPSKNYNKEIMHGSPKLPQEATSITTTVGSHVMEHRSSHLGQVLMLKKRFPEFPENIELEEKIKD